MNLIGIDVSGLDVPRFLENARNLFPLLALGWLWLVVRRRSPRLLLAGVLLANAWVFGVTSFPLQRLYGLGPSRDRLNNVGFCQVVAAGNPVLETTQVGQVHFEPLWGLLVAALTGFAPRRLLSLYAFLPLCAVLATAAALYFGLRPKQPEGEGWSAWERALVAGFATLLYASPLDFIGTYRVSWATTYMLKPNHALGLVLVPLVLRVFASARGPWGRIAAGLMLQALGWVFVIHMGFVALGLALGALVAWVARRPDRRSELIDVSVALGVNLLIVSPYLYMLLKGYPFLVPLRHAVISPWSPHLLEVTARLAWLFPLALWGACVAHRRGDRLGRVWVTQLASAWLVWIAYLGLSAIQMARERDEIYQWVRFLTAVFAAVGAWDLAGRAARGLRAVHLGPAWRAAALCACVLPWVLPSWWDPLQMDVLFAESLQPLPEMIRGPAAYLGTHSAPRDVVAGDQEYAPWVSALGARRVLLSANLHRPGDWREREELETLLLTRRDPAAARAAARRYGVRWLVVSRAMLERRGLSLEALQRLKHLEQVGLWRDPPVRFIALFKLKLGGAPGLEPAS